MKYVSGLILWLAVAVFTVFYGGMVLVCFPFVYFVDKQRHSLHIWGIAWAKTIFFFSPWKYNIAGKENLPKRGEAVVFVSNHLSQADILAVYLLGARFRWLSKASVFKVPFLGWAMAAIGYVGVNRGDRKSHERCMRRLGQHLKDKTPVFFFPEGTRSKDAVIKEFKSGAFRLAHQLKVPVVPISIVGTDTLLPKGSFFPGPANLQITVHSPIDSSNLSADQLAARAHNIISGALPEYMRGAIQHEQKASPELVEK